MASRIETLIPTPVEILLPRWEYGLAKLISEIFSPPLMVTVGLLFLGQQIGAPGVNWALFQIGLGILLPIIYIVIQVQREHITDFHMKVREQRIRPMLLTLLLTGVGGDSRHGSAGAHLCGWSSGAYDRQL